MHILVLGYSSIAQRRVLPALEKIETIKSVDIASLSSHDIKLSRNSKILRTFDNYEKAIKLSTASIIYISTINSLHEKLALLSLKSGRHVIVDKPAFLSLKTTENIIKVANNEKLGVAETTVFPSHPQFKMLTDLARRFSPIERIVATFTMPPFERTNYRWRPELGGGALNDLGPYAAAIARIFFTEHPDYLSLRVLNRDPETNIDTAFSLMADFGNRRSLIGTFGFDSEYTNSLLLFGPNCSLKAERIFSTPPELQNTIVLNHNNKIKNYASIPGDTFALMLNNILNEFSIRKFDLFSELMLKDAMFRNIMTKQAKTN